MATVYVAPAPTGDDTRTYIEAQNPSTPWATPARVEAAAVAGDTAIYADGVYTSIADPAYTKGINHTAETDLAAIWRVPGVQNFVARISSSAPPDSTFLFQGIVFDGNSQGVRGFAIGDNPARDYFVTFRNCQFLNATSTGLQIDTHRGRVTVEDCEIRGTLSLGGIVSTTDLGDIANAPFEFVATNPVFAITGSGSNVAAISLQRAAIPLSLVTAEISGASGSVASDGTGAITGILLQGIANAVVRDSAGLTVRNTNNANQAFGIQVTGKSATVQADNALIKNNELRFDCPAGHGIILGRSTSDSFCNGGVLEDNTVTGTIFTTDTPHNISLGQGTAAILRRNKSIEGYIGILASRTVGGLLENNVMYDCNGSGPYIKGCSGVSARNNISAVSNDITQRDRGILGVVSQVGVDNIAADIEEQRIYVQDVSQIDSLAQIATDQVCNITNLTCYVPDTVNLTTALLFKYKTTNDGDAANQTLAQWNANPEVTNTQVVLLPQASIDSIVAGLNPANDDFYTGTVLLLPRDPNRDAINVFDGNSMAVELRGLTRGIGTSVETAATVTAQLIDSTGGIIFGPLTLTHLGSGNYRAFIAPDISVTVGEQYQLLTTAVHADGTTGFWRDNVAILDRSVTRERTLSAS